MKPLYKPFIECFHAFIPGMKARGKEKDGVRITIRRLILKYVGEESKRPASVLSRFYRISWHGKTERYAINGRETVPDHRDKADKKQWKKIGSLSRGDLILWLLKRNVMEPQQLLVDLADSDPDQYERIKFKQDVPPKPRKEKTRWRKPRFVGIDCPEKMSKKDWLKHGKPNWWIRIGKGEAYRFLTIPKIPGTTPLFYLVDLSAYNIPEMKLIYYGVGQQGGVRGQLTSSKDSDYHEVFKIPNKPHKVIPLKVRKPKDGNTH